VYNVAQMLKQVACTIDTVLLGSHTATGHLRVMIHSYAELCRSFYYSVVFYYVTSRQSILYSGRVTWRSSGCHQLFRAPTERDSSRGHCI